MAANAYTRFLQLLPARRRSSAKVVSVLAGGNTLVESPAGNRYTVIGATYQPGDWVIVQGGQIVGQASGSAPVVTTV